MSATSFSNLLQIQKFYPPNCTNLYAHQHCLIIPISLHPYYCSIGFSIPNTFLNSSYKIVENSMFNLSSNIFLFIVSKLPPCSFKDSN